MNSLKSDLLDEMKDKLRSNYRLSDQEIALFRKLNLEQMKRDADNLNRAKWWVVGIVLTLAAGIFYCVRYV